MAKQVRATEGCEDKRKDLLSVISPSILTLIHVNEHLFSRYLIAAFVVPNESQLFGTVPSIRWPFSLRGEV